VQGEHKRATDGLLKRIGCVCITTTGTKEKDKPQEPCHHISTTLVTQWKPFRASSQGTIYSFRRSKV
jgi:hypothetical protein